MFAAITSETGRYDIGDGVIPSLREWDEMILSQLVRVVYAVLAVSRAIHTAIVKVVFDPAPLRSSQITNRCATYKGFASLVVRTHLVGVFSGPVSAALPVCFNVPIGVLNAHSNAMRLFAFFISLTLGCFHFLWIRRSPSGSLRLFFSKICKTICFPLGTNMSLVGGIPCGSLGTCAFRISSNLCSFLGLDFGAMRDAPRLINGKLFRRSLWHERPFHQQVIVVRFNERGGSMNSHQVLQHRLRSSQA